MCLTSSNTPSLYKPLQKYLCTVYCLLTDDLHVRRLDECEEGCIGHHLAAVAPGVVEVDVPQEQGLPVRQQALQPVKTLFMLIIAFELIFK